MLLQLHWVIGSSHIVLFLPSTQTFSKSKKKAFLQSIFSKSTSHCSVSQSQKLQVSCLFNSSNFHFHFSACQPALTHLKGFFLSTDPQSKTETDSFIFK